MDAFRRSKVYLHALEVAGGFLLRSETGDGLCGVAHGEDDLCVVLLRVGPKTITVGVDIL